MAKHVTRVINLELHLTMFPLLKTTALALWLAGMHYQVHESVPFTTSITDDRVLAFDSVLYRDQGHDCTAVAYTTLESKAITLHECFSKDCALHATYSVADTPDLKEALSLGRLGDGTLFVLFHNVNESALGSVVLYPNRTTMVMRTLDGNVTYPAGKTNRMVVVNDTVPIIVYGNGAGEVQYIHCVHGPPCDEDRPLLITGNVPKGVEGLAVTPYGPRICYRMGGLNAVYGQCTDFTCLDAITTFVFPLVQNQCADIAASGLNGELRMLFTSTLSEPAKLLVCTGNHCTPNSKTFFPEVYNASGSFAYASSSDIPLIWWYICNITGPGFDAGTHHGICSVVQHHCNDSQCIDYTATLVDQEVLTNVQGSVGQVQLALDRDDREVALYTGLLGQGMTYYRNLERLPSGSPTNLPTLMPSLLPTQTPTVLPTLMPTKTPSRIPTFYPSRMPTDVPTLIPSVGAGTNDIHEVKCLLGKNPDTCIISTWILYGTFPVLVCGLYVVGCWVWYGVSRKKERQQMARHVARIDSKKR